MTVYTVGHSNLPAEAFIELLRRNGIELLVDCRSRPYSAHNPQFNRAPLARAVEGAGIGYRFAGDQLGGRPRDPALCSPDGTPDYERIAASEAYRRGIEALIQLADERRVAVLCSEANPMVCHREKLIARTIRERGIEVRHIIGYCPRDLTGQLALFEPVRRRYQVARSGAVRMWLYLGLGAWECLLPAQSAAQGLPDG